jgi:RsmE family RNA methyltransferase
MLMRHYYIDFQFPFASKQASKQASVLCLPCIAPLAHTACPTPLSALATLDRWHRQRYLSTFIACCRWQCEYPMSCILQACNGRLILIVGPEGDFTDPELEGLVDAGAHIVGLGQHRLRVETAAIALLSASMLHFDDL